MSGRERTRSDEVGEALRRVEPELRAYCHRRIHYLADPAFSVDDVVQEVLLAVATAVREERLDPRRTIPGMSLKSYTFGVARHKLVDAIRTARRRQDRSAAVDAVDAADEAPGPEERLLQRELAGWAERLIGMLPTQQASVIRLRLLEGRSATEVAELLGTTPVAVRVAQHRALTTLRRLVATSAVRLD